MTSVICCIDGIDTMGGSAELAYKLNGVMGYGGGYVAGRNYDSSLNPNARALRTPSTNPSQYLRPHKPTTLEFTGFAADADLRWWVWGAALNLDTIYDDTRIFNTPTTAVEFSVRVFQTSASAFHLRVYRGATLLETTSTAFDYGVWHYIEVKLFVSSGTDGRYEVRMNGITVAAATDVTTSISVDYLIYPTHYMRANTGGYWMYDDLYWSVGDTEPDFLGDVVVYGALPTSDGNSTEWTALGGGDHYVELDDWPQRDADGSYIASSTLSQVDLFGYDDLPTIRTGYIGCVEVDIMGRGASEQIGTRVRSGASEAAGIAHTWSAFSGYTYTFQAYATNPVTGTTWSTASVNAAEYGVQVRSTPTVQLAVTRLPRQVLVRNAPRNELSSAHGFPVPAWISRRAVATSADSGYVQRRQVQSSVSRQSSKQAVRSWQLEWDHLSPSERLELQGVFDASIGRALSVWIKPFPDVAYIETRFASDSLEFENWSGKWYRAKAIFEEVI